MNKLRLLVGVSAAVLTIGMATPAMAQASGKPPRKAKAVPARTPAAQPAGDRAAGDQAAPKSAEGDRKAGGARKVVRLEEMRVEGRVQKPQALFLMPRASVNSGEQPDRSESFLSKTTDAVSKDPF
jgi:hypothetical protein